MMEWPALRLNAIVTILHKEAEMKLLKIGAVVAPLLMLTALAVAQSTPSPGQWGGCCGMGRWHMGPGWSGPGPMPRHHMAMMWGIPAPYTSMINPLPISRATVERGATVYAENCASCHGKTGLGDGEAGRDLSPPPGNLAWLSQMPMAQWDSFLYWTIAEGGVQFGTAMPAFKDTLAKDDIWAVTAYIQARLPQSPQ
jgi:mono/diheme cytochrome c family protein